jgi:uncharacterized membrane protein
MSGGLWEFLWVIIVSMLPISELRGGIPLAYFGYGWPMMQAFIVCVLANMVPVPFLLLLFDRVERFLRRYRTFRRFFRWLFKRTRKNLKGSVDRYGMLGLAIFVGIPLPMTGAWTGALGAYLFGMDFKRSTAAIFAGVVMAGVMVGAVCVFAPELLRYFGAEV